MFATRETIENTLKLYALISLLASVTHTTITSGEPVQVMSCSSSSSNSSSNSSSEFYSKNEQCQISDVKIDPCPEAVDNETCNAYRGSNMTITFNFKPTFSAADYHTAIYSRVLFVDIPDIEHERPGCKYTKCPIVAGETHEFKYTRLVKTVYPPGPYLVKYRLWHESSKDECCFLVNINIV